MKKEEIENQIEDLKKNLAELERQEKIEEEKRRREEEEAKGFWHEMTIRVKVYKKRDIDTNYYIMLNDLDGEYIEVLNSGYDDDDWVVKAKVFW